MAWYDRIPLMERFFNTGGKNDLETKDEVQDVFEGVSDQNVWKLIHKLRELERDRERLHDDYEKMSEDSVIKSAMEMMADDATQTDLEREKSAWIESKEGSKNNGVIDDLNEWLQDDIRIEKKLWTYAINVIKQGELYLKTYASSEEFEKESGKDLGDYFKLESNSLNISDLMKWGDTVGYYVNEEKKGVVYPPEDYIHFISDRGYNREDIKIIENEDTEEEEIREFTVRYGTSFLDAARQSYKVLRLMEDIMLMSRIVRSAMYRLFQIDVGSAGRKETIKIINEIKRSIESRETFDKMGDLFNSEKSPIPMNSNIYSPKRNGKGQIDAQEIGGHVNVKDIVDIEYFRNKVFAALKIPKAFLGFENELPGQMGSGGTSLTKMDIRYARTVKRIQTVIKEGIKDMCNFYLEVNDKKDKIGTFKVKMAKISSAEDIEKSEELKNRVQMADSINSLVSRDFESLLKKRDLLVWLVEDVIGIEGMKDSIKDEDEIDEEDMNNDNSGGGGGGFGY